VSVVALLFVIAAAGFAQVPSAQHVVLVIDENSSYSEVMANMSWTVGQGNAYGYAANYKSDNGGSLLDYLWLASGSCESAAQCTLPAGTNDFLCTGNDCYYPNLVLSYPITDDNIFRELNNRGIPWKVYAESYAAAGGTVTTPDNANGTSYYRRHNGATWYSDILSNVDNSANNVVDLSQLATDIASGNLPRFTIIVPDGNHDAHDCPVGMQTCTEAQKLSAADQFLETNLPPILALPDFQPGGTGLIFVTFDECGAGTDNGCGAAVYTAVMGPKVVPHTISNISYKHENTLRTMLDALGINSYMGAAATTGDMFDFFVAQGKTPQVSIGSPVNSASVNSPFTFEAAAIPSAGHSVSGWYVYVDGSAVYNTGATSTINPSLALSNGPHTIMARAWDTSGAFGSQTISVNVAPLSPIVAVSTPTNDSILGSPVNFIASASPTAGHAISGWWIYVDGAATYNAGALATIDANVQMSLGNHNVLVRAWDNSGAFGSQSLFLTVAAQPAVAVSTPLPGWNVISPMNVQASATPESGHSITGWYVYLDGVPVYNTGAVNSINTNVTASAGSHTLLVRAWDSSGAYGSQILIVQVGTVAVNVTAPMNGATADSPVNIQASANSAHTITGWYVYVDGTPAFQQTDGSSINANITMSAGTHSVMVRAWDSTGAYGTQTITVTVP
jgi:Phosphoesterase family/Bacterial Ig domain